MPALVSCLPQCYGPFGVHGALENLRSAGLEWLTLPVHAAGESSPSGDEPLVTTESGLAELKEVDRLLETHGIGIASCHFGNDNPLDEGALERIQRKLDLASHFGVEVAVGGAGEAETPEERDTLYGRLREIGDAAAERGITFCCDTLPGVCQHHRRMLETMQAVDHPHVRISFDTGNILYYNRRIEGEVALAKVCHLVKHVSLKDSLGEFGQWHFPALGRGGAVDFVRVLELMRATGFQGPYAIAVAGIAGEGTLALEDYHRRVESSVEELRWCGYLD